MERNRATSGLVVYVGVVEESGGRVHAAVPERGLSGVFFFRHPLQVPLLTYCISLCQVSRIGGQGVGAERGRGLGGWGCGAMEENEEGGGGRFFFYPVRHTQLNGRSGPQ